MINIDKVLLLSLFGGYTCKLLALGSNPSDAAIVLILAAAHFLYSSQIQNKQIDELKQTHARLQKDVQEILAMHLELKTSVASIKISSGMLQKVR